MNPFKRLMKSIPGDTTAGFTLDWMPTHYKAFTQYRQVKDATQTTANAFGLTEDTRVQRKNPLKHKENTYTGQRIHPGIHRKRTLNPGGANIPS